MIECLVLGDSLAVGVGQARPACETVAKVGITSAAYIKTMAQPASARSVVISLGVNDDPTVPTLDNLRTLRRKIRSNQVVWLLPGLKENVRQAIRTVAREHNDRTVDTTSLVGPDHLHPGRDGYRTLANWIEPGGDHFTIPGYNLVTSLSPSRLAQPPAGSTAPRTLSTLQPPKLVSMLRPGSAYGAWPVGTPPFAAVPPREFAFRALPLPLQATTPR